MFLNFHVRFPSLLTSALLLKVFNQPILLQAYAQRDTIRPHAGSC